MGLNEDLANLIRQFSETPPAPKAVFDPNQQKKDRIKYLIRKIAERKTEALTLFTPFPNAVPFFESEAKWRVLFGSNQSAKTTHAAKEMAAAFLGRNPRYPARDGRALVIGLSGKHLADPICRKLFEPGLFPIIPDEHTKQFRAVRADPSNPKQLDPYDDAYRELWRDSPPLIPKRFIKSLAWEDFGKGIPALAKFTTGWCVQFSSSDSKPGRGQVYHAGWIDEQIKNEQWYYELVRGMMALGTKTFTPRGIWSATPQDCNPELYELYLRAERGDQDVSAHLLLLEDNPFIAEREKIAFTNSLSDEERETRVRGKFAITGRRAYPFYEPMGVHGCEPFDIPDTWTRYAIVDPGTTHCATTFWAVDPDEQHYWIYDGFDLLSSNRSEWAREVKRRENGVRFEAFVIDKRAGKQRSFGDEYRVSQWFWKHLQEVEVVPNTIGPMDGFFAGVDDIPQREEAFRNLLAVRETGPFAGTPTIQVFRGCVPKLDKQIIRAHYDEKGKRVRPPRVVEDVLVTCEYAAAFRPAYRTTTITSDEKQDAVMRRWSAKQKKLHGNASGVVFG